MKCVMLSIRPKHCELIASGKKTVEVRKTKPKIDVPFKCYIYETKDKKFEHIGVHYADERKDFIHHIGKVIGEFVCDEIHDFTKAFFDEQTARDTDEIAEFLGLTCLKYRELCSYVGLEDFYGWHITDLLIYDKPKELSEFWNADKCPYASKDGCTYKYHCFRAGQTKRCGDTLTRPPQSWGYVENLL